jgi:hypothetical protein
MKALRAFPFLIGLTACLLYLFTGARTVQWQDSGQLLMRIATGTLHNEFGIAQIHPLHFALGRLAVLLFPGHPAWAVAGVSALAGGAAVGLAFAITRRIGGQNLPALLAALSLMLGHTFWRFSGLPEVYTVSAALLLLQILFLVRAKSENQPAWLVAMLGANGFGWANHNLDLLTLAIVGPVFLKAWHRGELTCRQGVAGLLLWVIGSLPFTMTILSYLHRADSPWPVLHSALFGNDFAPQVMSTRFHWPFLAASLAFTALSFPNLALPMAARALWKERRQHRAWMLPTLGVLALHLLFVLRYNVIDQYTFLIPAYGIVCVLAGVGYAALGRRGRAIALGLLLLQPLLYAAAPAIARASGLLADWERHKPYRDDFTYLFWPWTVGETSAARMAADAVDAASPNGVIVMEDRMGTYAVIWEIHRRGLDDAMRVLRPVEMEALVQAIAHQRPAVWVPARTDGPALPPNWERLHSAWRHRQGYVHPTDPLENP